MTVELWALGAALWIAGALAWSYLTARLGWSFAAPMGIAWPLMLPIAALIGPLVYLQWLGDRHRKAARPEADGGS